MFTAKQWLVIGLVAMLAGCGGSSSTMKDDGSFSDFGSDSEGGGSGATSSGAGDDEFMSGDSFDELMAPGGPLEVRVIYFEFDKSDVDEASQAVLMDHGNYLADNPDVVVRLEGHGDERGSREYNIGLGERRAQSVRQLLLLRGVTAVQISTVSYGEERPAVLGSDEEAMGLNRRVEIVYSR